MSRSFGVLVAWTIVACGAHPPDDTSDADPTTSGSGGATGSGGDTGADASTTGGTGGAGGSAGSSTGGSSGSGGKSSTTGSGGSGGSGGGPTGTGGSAGAGKAGSGGAAGRVVDASTTGGSSGAGGSTPPRVDAGAPGTQPSCASLAATLGAEGWLAFDSDHDNFHRNLYMMHADGSGLTQLTTGLNSDREPFFSPDGKQLSYTADVDGQPQIFIMDLGARASTKLTHRAEGADESSFSRDGQWIAFHSGASVYIIKTDGTGEKLVATGLAPGTNAYHSPVFSADGTELVFDRYNEIDATLLDGTGFRYVVGNTTTQIKSAAVSPTGADVAYHVGCYNSGGGLSVWTSSFSTTTQACMGRRVTPSDGWDAKNPAWATNAVIAYERVDPAANLATIAIISRVADSTPCILTASADDSRNPIWFSP